MIRKAIIAVLTMAAATAGASWVASYALHDEYRYTTASETIYMLTMYQGAVTLAEWAPIPPTTRRTPDQDQSIGRLRFFSHLFFSDFGEGPPSFRARGVSCPCWFAFIALAAYPCFAFAYRPLRRWCRHRRGGCLKCGYDLTGNLSGACPECGTDTPKPPPHK